MFNFFDKIRGKTKENIKKLKSGTVLPNQIDETKDLFKVGNCLRIKDCKLFASLNKDLIGSDLNKTDQNFYYNRMPGIFLEKDDIFLIFDSKVSLTPSGMLIVFGKLLTSNEQLCYFTDSRYKDEFGFYLSHFEKIE